MRKGQPFKKKYRFCKKRKFYKKKFFWFGILTVIFLATIFYLVVFSPIFQIKKLEIKGTEKVIPEEIEIITQSYIRRNFLLFSSKSIFLLNFPKIKKILSEKFLEIENINLKRKFPDRLVIEIQERKPVAILCQEEKEDSQKCFFLDKEGIIFEEVLSKNKNDYLVINVKPGLNNRVKPGLNLEKLLEIQNYLRENLKISLENVFQESEEKLIAKTKEGWEIYFNLKENLQEQLKNLELVLEKEILPERRGGLEYIDLRFGNKVYYKFR